LFYGKMIDLKEEMKLNYTEDFRIACKINNLKHEELIQYFIDHVSFYTFIGGEMGAVNQWATKVCIDCKDLFGAVVERENDNEIRRISLKYIKKLTALSLEDEFTVEEKVLQSDDLIEQWSYEMLPLTNYKTEFATGEGEILYLSFELNLLCKMNGVILEQLLQCFIDSISLSKERAVNLHEMVEINPGMAVLLLMLIGNNEVKNRIMPHQDIYKKYGLKLLKLDKKQREELNLQNRMDSYHSFYLEWYDALNNLD